MQAVQFEDKPLKCAFGVSSRKFLGFNFHMEGINLDLTKAKAIEDMKSPITCKQLKSFVGRVPMCADLSHSWMSFSSYFIRCSIRMCNFEDEE